MQKIILKTYQDQPIHFDLRDEMMINFTEMCKPFGKKPIEFLRLPQTKAFLQELAKSLKFTEVGLSHFSENQAVSKIVITIKDNFSGKPQGTWIHRKVAIKAAAWLSPVFEVWIIEQIETLLTQESVTLSNNSNQEKYSIDLMNIIQQQHIQITQLLEQQAQTNQEMAEIKTQLNQLNNMTCMKNTQSLDIFALDLAQYIEHTCGRLYDQGILTQAQLKEIKNILKQNISHSITMKTNNNFDVLEYILKQREYKKTYKMIAEDLQQKNIPTPSGKGTWNADRVSHYLKKYR